MRLMLHNLEDQNDPYEGIEIIDADELLRTLDDLGRRNPSILELQGENGFRLTVGIGGPACCIQHSSVTGDPPYLVAVANGDQQKIFEEGHVFMCGGQATEIAAEHCVSFSTLKSAALYFLLTGERNPDLKWEPV